MRDSDIRRSTADGNGDGQTAALSEPNESPVADKNTWEDAAVLEEGRSTKKKRNKEIINKFEDWLTTKMRQHEHCIEDLKKKITL